MELRVGNRIKQEVESLYQARELYMEYVKHQEQRNRGAAESSTGNIYQNEVLTHWITWSGRVWTMPTYIGGHIKEVLV